MAECEVSMASEVNEFEHNESLCISLNEEVNGEKYDNSVLNIQDEKQAVSKDLHPIVDRSITKTWVDVVKLDVVKKSCLHGKAKVKVDKLDISIIPLHESVASSHGVEKASEPSTTASASLITIPTVPRFIKRRIHEHAVDEVTSPQNLVELTQKTPNESVTSNSKSIKKVVNEGAINVHVNAFDALTSDEVHEEPIKSREEIESMRREKGEGKLKSRKKGQAEKLQLLKTHEEAEEREKMQEREKRVRKKAAKQSKTKSIPPPKKLQQGMGITTTFIIILLVFCFCLRIILS